MRLRQIHAIRAVGTLVATLALSGCIRQPEQVQIDGQDVQAVFLHTSDIHSRLVPYQMDVGKIDEELGLIQANAPFGGISRLSTLVRQQKRNHDRVLYIDTGDVFQGAPIFNEFLGEPEFKALNQLGLDVFIIGNHEFDNGAKALTDAALRYANFPMLGGNYYIGDWRRVGIVPTGQIASPVHMLNLKGLRVAVIGLTYMGGSHGGAAKGLVRLRTVDTVQGYIDTLRPVSDLIVVGSHLGYHDDQETIPRIEGADIFFGGHLHIALNPPNVVQDCDIAKLKREMDRYRCDTHEKQQARINDCLDRKGYAKLTDATTKANLQKDCEKAATEECRRESEVKDFPGRLAELKKDIAFLEKRGCHPRNVLLVHSGAFLKYMGRLETTLRQCNRLEKTKVCLERDASNDCLKWVDRRCTGNALGDNDWEVISHKYELTAIDKEIPDDSYMVRLMEPYLLELNRAQQLSQILGYTRERVPRFSRGAGDSQLGNLVCDSMLERTQVWADFAVTNSLGVRSDIVAGPVDGEQMNNVFPFENSVTVMYLSGYEVQEMADFIAQRSASRGCQSQAQVSGITMKLICAGCFKRGGNDCARVDYDGEPCAQRVTIGGSGTPCATDSDCDRDARGKFTGEICTGQALASNHPDRAKGKSKQCGLPISCTRSYRLATNDYVAHGGSGFTVLARNRTQQNLKIPLRDAATDYIVNMPACARIPQTWAERQSGRAYNYVVGPKDKAALKQAEALAQKGSDKQLALNVITAQGVYTTLTAGLANQRGTLTKRRDNQSKTNPFSEPEQNMLTGLDNYLSCVSGVGRFMTKLCTAFDAKDKAQCLTLARIRAALRCFTVPCINAKEDGRIQRDMTRAPNFDDTTYPE